MFDNGVMPLIVMGIGLAIMVIITSTAGASLNGIKSKTVGDGQHGTARFATKNEVNHIYKRVAYKPKKWREGLDMPDKQGLILGCDMKRTGVTAYVDDDDIHCLMIGAAGAGKTAFFLYPNIEYACATGMSWLCTDTKGDLARNYGSIAKQYGYKVAVLDLRNPMQSDRNNILHLVNKYMDMYKAEPDKVEYKAKAEKYAKNIAKTIINAGGGGDFGQNAFFYESAEGIITAIVLLLAELCPPETRHIVSVFKLLQDLVAPSDVPGQTKFKQLMELLPEEHKARWFSGAALNTSEQAMASVLSTAMARLNVFLDSEMEQILCFDTQIDAEKFCAEKTAVFIILPEEDVSKYFMASLIVQQMYREILTVADETGGKLKNRVMFFLDEIGTLPKIESLEIMFSAIRSRRVTIVAIIQSFAQLEKNYGKEGSSIIIDNCQDIIFGCLSPVSTAAEKLSGDLGDKTVLTGSVSKGKGDPSRSMQMTSRRLMTPDELKSMPKGQFVVMKSGVHPMISKLALFLDWGITFGEPYTVLRNSIQKVSYANCATVEQAIRERYSVFGNTPQPQPQPQPQTYQSGRAGRNHAADRRKPGGDNAKE